MTHRIGRRRSADPVTDGCEVLIQTGGTALDRDLLRVTEDRSECRASLPCPHRSGAGAGLPPRPMPLMHLRAGMMDHEPPRSSLPTSTPFSISAGPCTPSPRAQRRRASGSGSQPRTPGLASPERAAGWLAWSCASASAGRSAASTDLTARAASIARRTCAIDPAMSPDRCALSAARISSRHARAASPM